MITNAVYDKVQELDERTSEALGNPLYVMTVDIDNNATFWSRPGALEGEDFIVSRPPAFPKEEVSSILHVEAESRYCFCRGKRVWCCKMVDGIEICWKTDRRCDEEE